MKRKAAETGALVRKSVRPLVDASPAYRSLPPDSQKAHSPMTWFAQARTWRRRKRFVPIPSSAP